MSKTRTLTIDLDSPARRPVEALGFDGPEAQSALRFVVQRVMERMEQDPALHLPQEGTRDPIPRWLADCRERYAVEIEERFRERFAILYALIRPEVMEQVVRENVWPDVSAGLVRLFVRASAARWAAGNTGDAVRVGEPHQEGDEWVVCSVSPVTAIWNSGV